MNTRRIIAVAAGLLGLGSIALAQTPARTVEIRYDITKLGQAALEVWVDCVRREPKPDFDKCGDGTAQKPDDPSRKRIGPEAFGFRLRSTDQVVIVLKWKSAANTRADITYAITGSNVQDKDLEALKKLVGVGADAAKGAKTDQGVLAADEPSADVAEIKSVTEDLTQGGRVNVTFTLKRRTTDEDGATKENVVDAVGPLTFRIDAEQPRFTVSTGLAFSTAAEPSVAIAKTSTIVSFEKDGSPQQAYQQVIILRDNDADLQPIQSLVTLANFRLVRRMYVSLGFQLNQKLFEEPLLGLTYRHPLGSLGLNFTAAIHFSREQAILESTGFKDGQTIDPTIGLTVDDIKTEPLYHRRAALVFSVDF